MVSTRLQRILPHHGLSRLAGWLADCRISWIKNALISRFVKAFPVTMEEAIIEDPLAYASFNDFFTRTLKAGVRDLSRREGQFISPVDGEISAQGSIDEGRIFQAKGHDYTLEALFASDDSKRLAPYRNGQFSTIYLAPHDYHRIHMPIDGQLKSMTYVPGRLFSVNQSTVANIPGVFAKNERLVLEFDTDHGPMCLIFVGAMIVGSMAVSFAGTIAPHQPKVFTRFYDRQSGQRMRFQQGDEIGMFHLGSTVIAVWSSACELDPNLTSGSSVRLGQTMGAFSQEA